MGVRQIFRKILREYGSMLLPFRGDGWLSNFQEKGYVTLKWPHRCSSIVCVTTSFYLARVFVLDSHRSLNYFMSCLDNRLSACVCIYSVT